MIKIRIYVLNIPIVFYFKPSNYSEFKNGTNLLDDLNIIVYEKLISLYTSPNIITMAWVKKIGVFLMEYVELYVGSNIINKMSSNFIDKYGQLNYKNAEIYKEFKKY